jgi:FtsH-binding integral membrane protein
MAELLPELEENRRWRRDDYLKWAVRALAFFSLLVVGFTLLLFLGEGTPGGWQRMPFVSPGAPFGTYAENTQLGILTLAAGFGLLFVGAILAFRWQRIAAGTLTAAGAVYLFLSVIGLLDTTRPHDNGPIVMPTLFVLVPLSLAGLLLGNSRRRAVQPAASGSVGGV